MVMDIGVQLSVFHINWKGQFGNLLLQAVTKSLRVVLQTCPSNAVALSSSKVKYPFHLLFLQGRLSRVSNLLCVTEAHLNVNRHTSVMEF